MMNSVRLCWVIGLLVLSSYVHGQAYRPMLVEGNEWGQYTQDFYFETWGSMIGGDTILSGITYSKLHSPFNLSLPELVLLREDTALQQIWFELAGQEHLLYDMSVSIGDTITIEQFTPFNGIQTVAPVVLRLDSMNSVYPPAPNGIGVIQGAILQPSFVYLSPIPPDPSLEPVIWLKGVGSLAGPLFSGTPWYVDPAHLICATDSSGGMDWEHTEWMSYSDSCTEFHGFWDEVKGAQIGSLMSIGPNPATDHLHLSSSHPKGATNTEFVIMDAAGREVHRFAPGAMSKEIDMDISDLRAGLHLLRYAENGLVKWSGKFMKE